MNRKVFRKSILVLFAAMSFMLSACSPEFDLTSALVEVPDVSKSSFDVYGSLVADGRSQIEIRLVIKDAKGKAIPNLSLGFAVSGSGNVISACTKTDVNGAATCSFSSDVAGEKLLTIFGRVSLQKFITLQNPSAQPMLFGVVAAGGTQTTSSGAVVTTAVGIAETDIRQIDSYGSPRLISSHLGNLPE